MGLNQYFDITSGLLNVLEQKLRVQDIRYHPSPQLQFHCTACTATCRRKQRISVLIGFGDIHQTSPIPKEQAHRQQQSHFFKLCRGKQMKLKCTAGAPFKSSMTVIFFYKCTADHNRFSIVVLNLGLRVYTEFPCLKIFPLHNFQKWDCLCILAHSLVLDCCC